MLRSSRPARTLAIVACSSLALVASACGGSGGSDADDEATPTTTEAPATTTTTEPATTTTEAEPEPEPDDEGTGADVVMVGDKSVVLDGFFGVVIPDGWEITSAATPRRSSGTVGETELDVDSLVQALVLNPEADPDAATFSLVHYQHSDAVPGLAEFTTSIQELLAADGSQITEPQEATLGGQQALLHQVQTTEGTTGLMVTLEVDGEYFFIVSLVPDKSFSTDTASMLTSVSFEPAALQS
jgi:hypothetical protein